MKTLLKRLLADRVGNTLVEFAILAPALLTAAFGVFQVGAWVQNYNAIRNVAMDSARFAAVEYQRGNEITNAEIEQQLRARAVSDAYNLTDERLTITVNDATTRITGVKELDVDISYAAPDWLANVNVSALTLTYSRPIFLPI